MAGPLDDKLVVGIASRALFALDEANDVFEKSGLAAYRAYQREHEDEPLGPGTAFPLVRGLLAINERADAALVEIIVLSRNDADSAMRIFNSIEHHNLGSITRGAFTDGRDVFRYLKPYQCDLFLSANPKDVIGARQQAVPAALVLAPPESYKETKVPEVRIAFDGDAVLFDAESERFFKENGLEAFQEREARLADKPMDPGPFEPFLRGLQRVQTRFPDGDSPIRISLVTARNAPAHKRVINTLRSWGVRVDETFFLGGIEKAGVLDELQPHIFFDDQLRHLERARRNTPSAHVIEIAESELDVEVAAPRPATERPTPAT